MDKIKDINIKAIHELPKPRELLNEISLNSEDVLFVADSRRKIADILFGNDPRLLILVGPCSIHDAKAGIEYAKKLKKLSEQVQDRILLVMRAYFEKPRTSFGWQGLILDPHLDNSKDIITGLRIARAFLLELIQMKIPTATELLDPITPQYISDLIGWSAIGARTTESQMHRQLASGLSMPLGFKNSTNGSIKTAINAIDAAINPQTFMGINEEGQASYIHTRGNPNCHIVLRGGKNGPNYDSVFIQMTEQLLEETGLSKTILVDCSHGNSNKDHTKQPSVFRNLLNQIQLGNQSIKGIMLESNLNEGKQAFPLENDVLSYGISITDSCIDWNTTETLIREAHEVLGKKMALAFA